MNISLPAKDDSIAISASRRDTAVEARTDDMKSVHEGELGEMSKLGTTMTEAVRHASGPYEGPFGD